MKFRIAKKIIKLHTGPVHRKCSRHSLSQMTKAMRRIQKLNYGKWFGSVRKYIY